MIRIGICGYGNLGRGVESEISKCKDMELVSVFTKRKPVENLKIKANVPVVHIDDAIEWKDKIDVMILCGGAVKELPTQTPEFAKTFNVIDSFDTHAKALEHFKKVDVAAKSGRKIAIISVGWDPGLFSLMRLLFPSMVPDGQTYSFWGYGVSQGHSQAIRGIDGVEDAVQYTIPNEEIIARLRNGEALDLTIREKHTRLCYVVAKDGADKAKIEREIKEMPNYFSDYDTTVNFIAIEELKKNHNKLPHGGNVIHVANLGDGNKQIIELSHKTDSNPEFTASILLAYARAAYRLFSKGETGARTVFDIPPILLSCLDKEEIIKTLI